MRYELASKLKASNEANLKQNQQIIGLYESLTTNEDEIRILKFKAKKLNLELTQKT